MASCARREIIRPGAAGIFHCWQRTVRRAYLLGKDPLTGKDHTHRREWFIQRLRLLVSCFAIDVAFEAILSNHFHLILRTNPRLVKRMGDWEVARRWLRIYPGKRVLDENWIEPTDQQIEALVADKAKLAVVRKQLSSVSKFMAALSEYIARRANGEDGCDGRFFSGRFSCREITHDAGLLVAGLYVDLNLIRAGEAQTPETSLYTSAWFRIQSRQTPAQNKSSSQPNDSWLAPLTLQADHLGDVPCTGGERASDKGLLSMTLDEYLQLLDFGITVPACVHCVDRRGDQHHYVRFGRSPTINRGKIDEFDAECVGDLFVERGRVFAIRRMLALPARLHSMPA